MAVLGGIEPPAGVHHLEACAALLPGQAHGRLRGGGVLHDVAERLLCHPVERERGGGREPRRRLFHDDPDRQMLDRLDLLRQRAQRGGQTEVVEDRRMHAVRQPADLLPQVAQLGFEAGEVMQRGVRAPQQGPETRDLLADESDPLDQVVVQLARDPGALLLLRLEQLPAELPLRAQEPALLDEDRKDDGGPEDDGDESRRDEDPPEFPLGRLHSTPRVTRR